MTQRDEPVPPPTRVEAECHRCQRTLAVVGDAATAGQDEVADLGASVGWWCGRCLDELQADVCRVCGLLPLACRCKEPDPWEYE